jgi:hypothetical protein
MTDITLAIARKCTDEVCNAIDRNMDMVIGARAKGQVAFHAAAAAIGTAGGAFVALSSEQFGVAPTDDQTAEALWAILKPMILKGMPRLRERREGAPHA